MSYVSSISDTSYDHSESSINVRCNDLYVDGEVVAPNLSLPSARYNISLDIAQNLEPTDPNPSYVAFDSASEQNLYEYSNSQGMWEFTDPTTITILTEGNYLISVLMNVVSDINPGSATFQIMNLLDGPIGTVPPVCSTNVAFDVPPFVLPFSFVGTNTGISLAHIAANTTIRVAYVVSESCTLTPTSSISICKV